MPHRDVDQRRAYARAWMRRNAEKAREAMRRWRAAHRETDRARKRAHYAANPAQEKARVAAAIKHNPEGRRVIRQARRARVVAAPGTFTLAEWRDLLARHGGRCAYCGATGSLTADHRVPLCYGGANAIENILPACRRCNARKGTSAEREFRVRLLNERLRSTEFEVVDWWAAGPIQSVT
jgi:5-methylcytosine-specific restriction endonuclease McrA